MTSPILERWYSALRAGDAGALAAVTTDDVTVLWNGPREHVPWAGTWTGRDEVLRFFGLVASHLEVLSVETLDRVETDDRVAVVLAGHWRVRASGREMRLRAVNLFRFRDGRVAAYEVYPDSAAFVAALAEAGA